MTYANDPLRRTENIAEPSGRNEHLAIAEITILGTIFLLALVGNLFMLVTLRHKNRRSRMYFFMFHLSLADLLVAVFHILPQFIWDITYRFFGGDMLCRAVKFGQVMPLYLSTYILVAMAVDRYRAICCFERVQWSSMKIARALVLGSYVLAALLTIPQPFLFKETEVSPGVTDCWVVFELPWGARAYVTWFTVMVFVLPLLVIIWCYVMISYKIWKYSAEGSRSVSGDDSEDKSVGTVRRHWTQRNLPDDKSLTSRPMLLRRSNSNRITRAKVKTIKMSFVVVLCFIACWAPYCVVQLFLVYAPPENAYNISAVMVIIQLLASLNSCTNPWIYLAFSGTLLNGIKDCFGYNRDSLLRHDSIGFDEHQRAVKAERLSNDLKKDAVPDLKVYQNKSVQQSPKEDTNSPTLSHTRTTPHLPSTQSDAI